MINTVFILLALFLSFSTAMNAQKTEHIAVDVKSDSAKNDRSDFVKNDVPVTDSLVPFNKTGSAEYFCNVSFDNYTGYWLRVYIDGDFKGYIEPFGFAELKVPHGSEWFVESAGGMYTWTNSTHCCSEGTWINLRD